MNTHTHTRIPSSHPSLTRMSGFSMVEMMISITIGLMIVSALVGVLISTSGSTKTNDRTAELQSNGRYALDQLKRELREAGYRGYTAQAPQSAGWTTPNIPGECGTAGSFVKNIRQAVWGQNDSNPFAANCIPAASYSLGDVLVIRNAANTPTPLANALANTIYLRSTYATANVLQGSSLPADAATAANFALVEHVYYISPFTNSAGTTGVATESPQVPALYRVSLQANGSMTAELIVTGIEHMQVEYGMTNSDGTIQYFSASSIGSATDHSATGATSWDQISAVRIWLLARNSKAETGYSNTSSYTMGDITYGPVNDSFRRQVFTSVVQLRNFRNAN